jgi:hypothetical protein
LTETAIVFGGRRLVGILSQPARRDPSRPCVVLLNAGLVHRPGPGRLSVQLARSLRAAGVAAFRFDLSGLGDSEPRVPPLPVSESIVADVRDALDQLGAGTSGFRTFVLGGLCSGAIGAHYASAADDRVAGLVSLDGYSFKTPRWRLHRGLDRLRDPVGLAASLLRHGPWHAKHKAAAPALAADLDDGFLPRWPTRVRAEADLAALVRRGVHMLHVFSGEWECYRYEGQIREAFPRVDFGALLTERRIPLAEHLYFTPPERLEVLELVTRWVTQRFPAAAATST